LEAVGAIENADVLDLFAGTGALGLEALSRGAKSLVAIESARAALNVCLKNSASVGTALSAAGAQPPMEIKLSDAVAYLASTIKEFDLVFADPPYDLRCCGEAFGASWCRLATKWTIRLGTFEQGREPSTS
jgi:16S rRNA (guanine966-N2)-methyltransferase